MIETFFLPDAQRAVAIDARMRHELANSLEYLKLQIQKQNPEPGIVDRLTGMDHVVSTLRSDKKVRPAIFGYYYQLVFAILENASNLTVELDNLVASIQTQSEMIILDLSPEGLGDESLVALYQKCLDTDEGINYGFLPPGPLDSVRMRGSINRALQLMETIMPELCAEIHAIVSEIILASAPKTPNAHTFDGASSYQLWGALVLNTDEEKSDLEMIETLAHEAAHSLLFGLTITEPLVCGEAGHFKSPLRQDPRPMDGIYHATFVSARMHYAMYRVLKSSLLNDSQKNECKRYLLASRKAFYDGFEVISVKAELSDTGRVIMQNAYDFMQQVA